ncbi:hypothetical protein F4561_003577 [Lipingzhangella halophila]|uniref:Uncharacterized protein n=1 Tax=Lipingzhangella halophila TaxID=1783352 RepID=A0A7W7W375_9ACTN|nr:hypothetical protein [Lipingzhangella halophila]MBB4932757.1 hypothetical protein [Lipingzhangella halophila]
MHVAQMFEVEDESFLAQRAAGPNSRTGAAYVPCGTARTAYAIAHDE